MFTFITQIIDTLGTEIPPEYVLKRFKYFEIKKKIKTIIVPMCRFLFRILSPNPFRNGFLKNSK